jgi:EAL domain-containing protein (putative c-di-GMP-specific phosphodiesterase class I)
LEITESSLLQDTAASQATLQALAAEGIQIALDDFGTGYSSLAYLQQLHVHSLKIDKSFVDGVGGVDDDRTARALVRSVVELSSALELSTVAEGVETPEQVAELRRLGCRLGQGYVFSPAVHPDELRQLLASHGPSPAAPDLARPAVEGPSVLEDAERAGELL